MVVEGREDWLVLFLREFGNRSDLAVFAGCLWFDGILIFSSDVGGLLLGFPQSSNSHGPSCEKDISA